MKIDYQLTKQDYIDFNMNYMSNSKTVKRVFVAQRYITPIIFFLVAFVMTKVTTIVAGNLYRGAIVCYGLWIAFYPTYFRWASSKRILKIIAEDKSEEMLGKRCLTLTEKSIFNLTPSGESKTDWKDIKKITETQKHIFIFISSASAYILPARVFKNEDEKKKFMDNLNYMVDRAKGKKKIK